MVVLLKAKSRPFAELRRSECTVPGEKQDELGILLLLTLTDYKSSAAGFISRMQ
jgi:hypothetical protein